MDKAWMVLIHFVCGFAQSGDLLWALLGTVIDTITYLFHTAHLTLLVI